MKRQEKNGESINQPTTPSVPVTRNLSVCEARTFWQNRRKEGKVDAIFKDVQNKLQLLCQKIKDGSATNQDCVKALLLVNQAQLEDSTYLSDKNFVEELLEDKESPPVRAEDSIPINSEVEEPLPNSGPTSNDVPPPVDTSFLHRMHCSQMCLSNVNPYLRKRENPLKLPLMFNFQRRHAKSNLISRQLDVIYKAPCGKSLWNFDDVHSYLSHTKCHFLSVDHFSFNTYLQLDRNIVKKPVIYQDADISKDAELVPVPVCNEIDNTRPAPFRYRKSPWPPGYSIINFTDLFIGCCDCTDGCSNPLKCACLQLTAKDIGKLVTLPKGGVASGYQHKRLQAPVPSGLYECNVSCKCDRKMCQNRVVQQGLQVRLQVFKTKDKGWGVRCLDDLDKGTFVCIYAGQILGKSVDVKASQESIETNTKNTSCAKQRMCSSRSDSEIMTSPSILSIAQKYSVTPQLRESSQSELKRKSSCHNKGETFNVMSIKRPKTRTSILQKRRRQLLKEGTVTMQQSSDDDVFTLPSSPKMLHSGNRKGENANMNEIHTTRRSGVLSYEDEAGYVSDESSSPVQYGSKENTGPPDCNPDEIMYYLDASTEGNIGRFLNHSCSPNLFVQQVFVETHSKKFPWMAFFAKKFIKAGTELTWTYNYDIGSIPEKEISCLCGHKTCKNVII